MEIFILRHGKAAEHLSNVKSDTKRKLTADGKKEIEEISKGIMNFNIAFDYIISSPLDRAKQTAEIVAKIIWKKNKKITIWDGLKPESSVKETHQKLAKLDSNSKVLLVGHQPHLINLISSIISRDCEISINLKKGGFVHIKGNVSNSKIVGTLRSILTPKQLKLCI